MALSRSYTNKEETQKVIVELLAGILDTIKDKFEIEGLEFDVITEDFLRDKNGYKIKEFIKGSAVLDWSVPRVEKIILFTENISDFLNMNFSYIHDIHVFKQVLEITVKFVLIHELVHVKQVNNGMTKEDYERTKYEDNEYEREANHIAAELLSGEGEFTKEIVEYLRNKNKKLDNDNVTELINLYYTSH